MFLSLEEQLGPTQRRKDMSDYVTECSYLWYWLYLMNWWINEFLKSSAEKGLGQNNLLWQAGASMYTSLVW